MTSINAGGTGHEVPRRAAWCRRGPETTTATSGSTADEVAVVIAAGLVAIRRER